MAPKGKPQQQQQPATPAAAAPVEAEATAAAPAVAVPAPTAAVAAPGVMTMVVRAKGGLSLRRGVGEKLFAETVGEAIVGGDFSQCDVAFTRDGSLVACSNAEKVFVLDASAGALKYIIEEPNVTGLEFSRNNEVLVTYRLQDVKTPGDANLVFWNLGAKGVLTEILRCGQSTWPAVFFGSDGAQMVRRAQGHLMQIHDATFATKEPLATVDLQTPKGKDPVIATSEGPLPLLAVFVPQIKSALGYVKVFRLPNVKDEMLSRQFGNADQATLTWSPHFGGLLVVTQSDTDKSGGSYYGRTALSVFNLKERNVYTVMPGKDETIHDAAWSPTAEEFIVVHGQMPRNKATLYNAKAEAIYSFGESPRNYIRWSPNGKQFILGGNGNLAGECQFFERDAVGKRADGRLGFFSEKTSVQIWTPDSRSVVSANVFHRLRLDNRFTVWKHTGAKLAVEKFDELYSIDFVPVPHTAFRARPASPVVQNAEAAKPQAYRPPSGSSAAAAMLARQPAAAIGNAVKPAGPVGAVLAAPAKKGGRR